MVGKISELRPCPFCGSSDVHTVNMPNLRAATCRQCGSVAKEDTWNRRTTDAQLKTLMDELDVSLPDTERLDFAIKARLLPADREAIDALMTEALDTARELQAYRRILVCISWH